ncbi:MAG: aminotransferase class I/II-fold pyridoxal phosphate-dependent enzyme [Candidatus Gracilibacteria bacterium]|nr:aminotransferase class I/II-fold pyridoxal phosphate-dependent enzyme [Candidatus Gracilibacteria bacterium]
MEFFTTKYINELIKDEYISFLHKYYTDILTNPNKYISIVEKKISSYLGGGYVKLLNSGTTALQFGLLALGVKAGDEVILPANTYSATAIAITNIGAVPVFVDINLDNFTIDYTDIENKITSKTKAIIPVHLYGYNCNMKEIIDISKKHDLKIIEDASHAFGGEYFGEKLGTLGDIGAFSCHHSKNFGTFGNGGILYTKDKTLFDKIDNYIFPDKQSIEVLKSGRTPANIGVTEALVLLFKLKYIDKIIYSNIELYKSYLDRYSETDFIFPKLDLKNHRLHIRNFTVLSKNRDFYINNKIGKKYYEINLNKHKAFEGHNTILKNTTYFFENNLSLNFYFGIK